LTLMLGAAPAADEEWPGRVVGVQDGDSITVMRGQERVQVRLHGVDCPELHQAYGAAAKKLTSGLVYGMTVRVRRVTTDRYGRMVAVVRLSDGRVVQEELLRAGLAWWFRRYAPKERRYARLEEEAREARVGLWSEEDPTPPWLWRKRPKGAVEPEGR
jgi:endonuclease YncB( thermonuclease family)